MATLQLLQNIEFFESLFFRSLTGGSVGALTSSYLEGVSPFLSFLEACTNGDFELGGYFCIIGFIVMLFVWAYNLFTTRSVVVQ
jgi:hypothetical protein